MNSWNFYISSLYAESSPVLPDGIVLPGMMNEIEKEASSLIIGEVGSGKTTLHDFIKVEQQSNPYRIILVWHPEELIETEDQLESSDLSWAGFQQILSLCALELIPYLGTHNEILNGMPVWVQDGLAWFWDQFSPENPLYAVASRAGLVDEHSIEQLSTIATKKYNSPVRDLSRKKAVLATISNLLQQGLLVQSVWVLVDVNDSIGSPNMPDMLSSMLSTLSYFEQPVIKFKIFVPFRLSQALINTSGIQRSRLSIVYLSWHQEELWQIVQKRFLLSTGNSLPMRNQICLDENAEIPNSFCNWLEHISTDGNLTPRKWLRIWEPVLAAYLQKKSTGANKFLTESEWKIALQTLTPKLHLDIKRKCVFIDEQKVDLSDQNLRVIAYLYQQSPRICSHEEIYYFGIRGLTRIPGLNDEKWEAPKNWRSTNDSILNRLRKKIEPDPTHPIYIVTVHGQGIILENRD